MLDPLLSLSALPDPHPALVHFPIALLPLATAVDAAFALTARAWLERAGAALWALAAVAAWLAVWSGEEAAEALFNPPAAVERTLMEHSDLAHYAGWLAALVAALRVYLAWRDRARPSVRRDPLRLALLVAAVTCLAFLVAAVDHGGELVYRHGVGVSVEAAGAAPR